MISRRIIWVSLLTLSMVAERSEHFARHWPATCASLLECTVGVASGSVTEDGRPLIWKSRDNLSEPDNLVFWNDQHELAYLAVVTRGSAIPWMGVNEAGFAILNSFSDDLPLGEDGPTNGPFMFAALTTCRTLSNFRDLLDSTNVTGRRTQSNFAVLDTTGAVSMIETADTDWWEYSANDPQDAPNGFLVRANYSLNGGGTAGAERYLRSTWLLNRFVIGDSLNPEALLRSHIRDFSDDDGDPIEIPYEGEWAPGIPWGYIDCYNSICGSTTVSAMVIQGVAAAEPARFSTLWTILGNPAAGVAVPYWPVGEPPPEAWSPHGNAPLCDLARDIHGLLFDYESNRYIDTWKLINPEGGGLWTRTLPLEHSIVEQAEAQLALWRQSGTDIADMLAFEETLAAEAHFQLTAAYNELNAQIVSAPLPERTNLISNLTAAPNPFNPDCRILFTMSRPGTVHLTVYNILGEPVRNSRLVAAEEQELLQWRWDGCNENGSPVASGIYLVQAEAAGETRQMRITLQR